MNGELVHYLPDSYEKPPRGREEELPTNTWRMFIGAEKRSGAFLEEIADVFTLSDIDLIYGQALRDLASMYGVSFSASATDDEIRLWLKVRLAVLFGSGTIDDLLKDMADIFGTEDGEIYFTDGEETATVDAHIENIQVVFNSPVSIYQLEDIIQTLLPAGVQLNGIIIDNGGGFIYVESGREQDAKYDGLGYDELPYGTLG